MGQGQSASVETYQLLDQEDKEADVAATSTLDKATRRSRHHNNDVSTEELLGAAADNETDDESAVAADAMEAKVVKEETLFTITIEIFLPFLVSGFGMVAAGIVLDRVQHWEVFVELSQLFILVPALLGLKGNLEMTLASRLSTQANLGNMDSRGDCLSIVTANLALIQCQGIVVGFAASLFAASMDALTSGVFDWKHGLLLSAASLVTASLASFVLGVVMVVVILLSRKFSINPDNVATPIAASLGDLVTLSLLSWIASLLYHDHSQAEGWLAPAIIGFYALLVPICILVVTRNPETTTVLYTGWSPVIIAMSISSLGGLILNKAVNKFKGIAVFQPVFNGVGGNLTAVQASRISTYLHTKSTLGTLPKSDSKIWRDPVSIVIGDNIHSQTSRILLCMAIPGHFFFAFTISSVKAGHTTTTPLFFAFYLLAAFIQLWILLCCAHWMVLWMWGRSIDPDNASIPYLTALGDLLGGALLFLTFQFLFWVGDRDTDVGD